MSEEQKLPEGDPADQAEPTSETKTQKDVAATDADQNKDVSEPKKPKAKADKQSEPVEQVVIAQNGTLTWTKV